MAYNLSQSVTRILTANTDASDPPLCPPPLREPRHHPQTELQDRPESQRSSPPVANEQQLRTSDQHLCYRLDQRATARSPYRESPPSDTTRRGDAETERQRLRASSGLRSRACSHFSQCATVTVVDRIGRQRCDDSGHPPRANDELSAPLPPSCERSPRGKGAAASKSKETPSGPRARWQQRAARAWMYLQDEHEHDLLPRL